MQENNPIYLDYMATTPVDPRVAKVMSECLTLEGVFGNASSNTHFYGEQAKQKIEGARQQVLPVECDANRRVGVPEDEVAPFTARSGARRSWETE